MHVGAGNILVRVSQVWVVTPLSCSAGPPLPRSRNALPVRRGCACTRRPSSPEKVVQGVSALALILLPFNGPARFGIPLTFYKKIFSSGRSQKHRLALIGGMENGVFCVLAHLLGVSPL